MAEPPKGQLGHLFYTGASAFLQANENFANALVRASEHCPIHASEDIFDANGMKLWAGGQPIGDRLLERLSNRRLRKPIELCVYAADPVAAAGIDRTIEAELDASSSLGALLEGHLGDVLQTLRKLAPNPTELMLLSVMRHGGRDMLGHAALVGAVALACGAKAGLHPDLMRLLARAALLHDVGELYLPAHLFDAGGVRDTGEVKQIRTHASVGAQVAVELARCVPAIGHLIEMSHERLDGWGYPRGLRADELSQPAQALLFAEAMVPLMRTGSNGMKRAAVAARLVPGEFPTGMVDWIVGLANTRPATGREGRSAAAIGMDLLQIQALLSRLRVLLKEPVKAVETTGVRHAAARWRQAVETLIDELRRTGIESAISCGMSVEPQDDTEYLELSVLTQELMHRIRELRRRVELAQSDSAELGTSALAIEVLELLRACEREPPADDSALSHGAPVMSWSKLFSVGVYSIDEQHRVLIDLINRLGAASDGAAPSGAVDRALAALVDYVGRHFAFEEKLMLEHGYEEVDSHRAAHAYLADRVNEMVSRHQQASSVSLDELTVFLRQWLISHILHTDMELGAALNASGVH